MEAHFPRFILILCLCQHKSVDPWDKAFPLPLETLHRSGAGQSGVLACTTHFKGGCKSVWRHMCAYQMHISQLCSTSQIVKKKSWAGVYNVYFCWRIHISETEWWFRCTTRTCAWRLSTSQWAEPSGTRKTLLPSYYLTIGCIIACSEYIIQGAT